MRSDAIRNDRRPSRHPDIKGLFSLNLTVGMKLKFGLGKTIYVASSPVHF